jgi:hypothetical protein
LVGATNRRFDAAVDFTDAGKRILPRTGGGRHRRAQEVVPRRNRPVPGPNERTAEVRHVGKGPVLTQMASQRGLPNYQSSPISPSFVRTCDRSRTRRAADDGLTTARAKLSWVNIRGDCRTGALARSPHACQPNSSSRCSMDQTRTVPFPWPIAKYWPLGLKAYLTTVDAPRISSLRSPVLASQTLPVQFSSVV